MKPATCNRSSYIDDYYDKIEELLNDENEQVFFYKKHCGNILRTITV